MGEKGNATEALGALPVETDLGDRARDLAGTASRSVTGVVTEVVTGVTTDRVVARFEVGEEAEDGGGAAEGDAEGPTPA